MGNPFSDHGEINKKVYGFGDVKKEAKNDSTYLNLCRWAERIELIGILIIFLYCALSAWSLYEAANANRNSKGIEIIIQVANTLLVSLIIYAVYHLFALVLSALSRIVYNTKVTALVNLYSIKDDSDSPEENKEYRNEKKEREDKTSFFEELY